MSATTPGADKPSRGQRVPAKGLLAAGTVVAGYQIEALVGKGGMGEVYRARQVSMDRVVALKVLAPHLAKKDPVFAKRFVDEARAAGRFNNPNIVHVHDVGQTAAPPELAAQGVAEVNYFSMEYVDGETVQDLLKRETVCPPEVVARVMQGMARALAYAQEVGIVHRDIKPDNIMLGRGGAVKLADLGLALEAAGEETDSAERDAQGRIKVMGTPLYMSPQQARGLPLDHRSDQYSLGATLYHMLTGRAPYQGDGRAVMQAHVREPIPDPAEARADVPEAWRQLCLRLMEKEPGARFADSAQLAAAVDAAAHGITLARLEQAAQPTPWRLWLGVGGGAVALLVLVVALSRCGGQAAAPTDPAPTPAPAPATTPAPATPVAVKPTPAPLQPAPAATKAAAPPPKPTTTAATRPPAARPPSGPWNALRTQLEPLRTSLDYLKVRAAVEAWRKDAPAADAEAAQAALELGALASQGEGAVRACVGQESPVIEIRPNGVAREVRLLKLRLTEVWWCEPLDQTRREQMLPRASAGIPWSLLLQRALVEQDVPRREEVAAATLWMWRDGEAAAAMRVISDLPLGVALSRLEGGK
jgi:hypothetical protein